MKNIKLESKIIALLDGNEGLRQDWLQSPQVTHIPFMRTREKFFLLINVHMRLEANNSEKLLAGCLAAVQSIIGSGLLTDEKAVEISAFVEVPKRENLRRVFRLSVLDIAFPQIMQINASDLVDKQYIGITCQWPLRPPS
jgi:hypothetical protein